MRLKRSTLSIIFGITIYQLLTTKPSTASQILTLRSNESHAYVIQSSICDVFIREQRTSTSIPIYQVLQRERVRLIGFTPLVRPGSTPISQQSYNEMLSRFYHENCNEKSSYKDRPFRLNPPLPLTRSHIIEIPRSIGDIFLSCEPEDSADPIEAFKLFVVRWIDDNCS